MTQEIAVRSNQTLSAIAADLEAVCTEIDAENGEIKPELMQRFEFAQLALRDKCERWIGYVDGVKGMIETLKAKAERAQGALKTAKSFESSLRQYMKMVVEQNPNLTFKGESGTIYLHGQAEAIKYNVEFADKTVYRTVDPVFAQMEPTIRPYLTNITYQVIDTERLKADLKAGVTLNWAVLEKGSHIRVKGS